MVELKPEAKYIRFDTFDHNYYNGSDLKSAMHPETILAYSFNGGPLGPPRRSSAGVLADQAGLQAGGISHGVGLFSGAAWRVLGGSGVSVVGGEGGATY